MVDVASKRDEYRSIDPHELAEFLGIDDADKPGGDWKFVWYVTPKPIEDIFDWGNEGYALELLQPHVTAERYEELKPKIELATGTRLRPESLDFLTEVRNRQLCAFTWSVRLKKYYRATQGLTLAAPC